MPIVSCIQRPLERTFGDDFSRVPSCCSSYSTLIPPFPSTSCDLGTVQTSRSGCHSQHVLILNLAGLNTTGKVNGTLRHLIQMLSCAKWYRNSGKTLGGLFEVFRGCHVSQLVQVFVPSLGTVKILMPCKSQPTVKIWILSLSLSCLKKANKKNRQDRPCYLLPLGFFGTIPPYYSDFLW